MRNGFDALFGLDDAMADIVLRAREPQLAAIKLAWWREQLEALDGGSATAVPLLDAAARSLLPHGITGERLSRLEDGWLALLQPEPELAAANGRGEILFALAGDLLGVSDALVRPAGRLWSAADLARRTGSPEWLIRNTEPLARMPPPARPLTGLAALALRDYRSGFPLEAEGTPARAWTLLRHRMTGHLQA